MNIPGDDIHNEEVDDNDLQSEEAGSNDDIEDIEIAEDDDDSKKRSVLWRHFSIFATTSGTGYAKCRHCPSPRPK